MADAAEKAIDLGFPAGVEAVGVMAAELTFSIKFNLQIQSDELLRFPVFPEFTLGPWVSRSPIYFPPP